MGERGGAEAGLCGKCLLKSPEQVPEEDGVQPRAKGAAFCQAALDGNIRILRYMRVKDSYFVVLREITQGEKHSASNVLL